MSPRSPAAALQRTAPLFAALGDATRLYVIGQLCAGGPQSIAKLTEGSNVSRQAVTKHLAVLADAGLVRGHREGREMLWELEVDRLDEVRRTLDVISGRWDAALARLQRLVEDEA